MRKVVVRLSDEMAAKLEVFASRHRLRDLEEAMRFAARFTLLTLQRIEERGEKSNVLTAGDQT